MYRNIAVLNAKMIALYGEAPPGLTQTYISRQIDTLSAGEIQLLRELYGLQSGTTRSAKALAEELSTRRKKLSALDIEKQRDQALRSLHRRLTAAS